MVDTVTIHYRRPPNRLQIFEQQVVASTSECTITYLPAAELSGPTTAGDRVILEPGSAIVWLTYPGQWHDIGRFHRADGEFTGYYANVLTPVVMDGSRWETTDLFLDVWLPRGGDPVLLDEAELEEAVRRGWVDESTAAAARDQAARLLRAARSGTWPPREALEWTLERVRERLAG